MIFSEATGVSLTLQHGNSNIPVYIQERLYEQQLLGHLPFLGEFLSPRENRVLDGFRIQEDVVMPHMLE